MARQRRAATQEPEAVEPVKEESPEPTTPEEPETIDAEPEEEKDEEGGAAGDVMPVVEATPNVEAAIARGVEVVLREREEAQPPAHVLPSEREWRAATAIAERLAASTGFVPAAFRGKPDDVLAAILSGRELGIGPMQSLRQIHIIDGRAALSADLLLAQLRRGGIQIVESESTRERARIRARRRDTGEIAEVEWTIEDARNVQQRVKGGGTQPLTEKDNWKNYPADMLWARAVGRLARRLGSDLVGGMPYSKEEVEDFEDWNGSEYDAAPWARPKLTTLGKEIVPADERAPSGWAEVGDALSHRAPHVDWKAVGAAIRVAFYGSEYERANALPEDDLAQFGRRLSAVVVALDEITEGRDFPPATDEEVSRAVATAFEGVTLATPLPTRDATEGVGNGDSPATPEEPAGARDDPSEPDPEPAPLQEKISEVVESLPEWPE